MNDISFFVPLFQASFHMLNVLSAMRQDIYQDSALIIRGACIPMGAAAMSVALWNILRETVLNIRKNKVLLLALNCDPNQGQFA